MYCAVNNVNCIYVYATSLCCIFFTSHIRSMIIDLHGWEEKWHRICCLISAHAVLHSAGKRNKPLCATFVLGSTFDSVHYLITDYFPQILWTISTIWRDSFFESPAKCIYLLNLLVNRLNSFRKSVEYIENFVAKLSHCFKWTAES